MHLILKYLVAYYTEDINTKFQRRVTYFNTLFRNGPKALTRPSEMLNVNHYAEETNEIQMISEKSMSIGEKRCIPTIQFLAV